uniref:Glycosyl transferase family 1 domain-containing protein n=1 Tax=Dunaliella tertiolecta TaxID=3047 RepID=A0A7S3R792_DUNTE
MEKLGLPAEWAGQQGHKLMLEVSRSEAATLQAHPALKSQAEYEAQAVRGPHPIRLKYNILYGGQVWSRGGYGNEAISFILGLLSNGLLAHENLWWVQAGDHPSEDVKLGMEPSVRQVLEEQNYRNMSKKLRPDLRDRPIVSIGHTFPNCWRTSNDDAGLGVQLVLQTAWNFVVHSLLGFPVDDSPCPHPNVYVKGRIVYRVGRTMFETEVLPHKLAAYADFVDEVWVPSSFNVESFQLAKIDPAKLFILPQGVNTTEFDPERHTPFNLSNATLVFGSSSSSSSSSSSRSSSKPFRFLSVFKWESRKGWDILLTGFFEEFKVDDNVELHIVTKETVQKIHDFRSYIRQAAAPLLNITESSQFDTLPRVYVHHRHIPDSLFPGLYRATDALVLPTHGEGWGRPQIEAMSMAKPVISTNWSGVATFLHEGVGYPIRVEGLVEAADEGANSFGWFKHQRWAQPSKQHLKELMRQVVRDPTAAAAKGAAARKYVVDHFSLLAVAHKLLAQLLRVQDIVDQLLAKR